MSNIETGKHAILSFNAVWANSSPISYPVLGSDIQSELILQLRIVYWSFRLRVGIFELRVRIFGLRVRTFGLGVRRG